MPTSQQPPSFWEVHQRVGEVELSAHGRVLVSTVMREGQWCVRLCPLRLAQRGGEQQWLPGNQVLLFPPEAVPALRALLQQAVERLPPHVARPHGTPPLDSK